MNSFRFFQNTSFYTLLFILPGLVACKPDGKKANMQEDETTFEEDIHSFAQPEALIRHLDLDIEVDFSKKEIRGTAAYDIRTTAEADSIYFDTKDIRVSSVTVDGEEVPFQFGNTDPVRGTPLSVAIAPSSKRVVITYQTQPGAEALQWLDPEQTAGKQHPFLFTQGQAILTRTWIPIQDSPGIRFTYYAKVSVPADLMAVMSASNPQEKSDDGQYVFRMTLPIPAYLIALSVGDIAFQSIGERTGVYAEPSVLPSAADEFVDMEKMLKAAEALYGPYRWDRYDVIVLPPSFPFGGMENPKLTFATPTIIAGDRSLVALIAHELAHSWSGNLVTNATWNDFWLNEGFTVYFEWRIMEALYGASYVEMLRQLGHQGLTQTVKELDPKDTHLFLDLEGRNPDDGMTDIAYEKGAHFLLMLEEKTGREKFDAFLRQYFDTHAFQSMSTTKFVEYLRNELLIPNKISVNLEEWIYGPGLPDNCPVTTNERFDAVDAQVKTFLEGASSANLQVKDWTTHEWLHFIMALPSTLSDAQMKDLDTAFSFTSSGNREIQAAWYKLAITQGYGKNILSDIRQFLVEVGRRKFLTPLYTAMKENGMEAEAKSIFAEAKKNYHSVSYQTIEGILQ